MLVDSRGFNLVPDTSQFSGNIGDLIKQKIADRLGQSALGQGPQAEQSMAHLASRDPNQARAVGGILQDRQAMAQREQQEAAQKQEQRQSIMARIATGFETAGDKLGYMTATASMLRQNGMEDLAAEVDQDIQEFAVNPSKVTQEWAAAKTMYGPERRGDLTPAGVRQLEYLTKDMTPEEAAEARRVAAGLAPRASIDASEYGKREEAKLEAQRQLKAQVAGEVAAAQEGARRDVSGKTAEDAAKREASMSMAQEAYQLATELAESKELGNISGPMSRVPTVRPTSNDLIIKAQRLEALLTVDNLKLMTGVLTDRDIQFLVRIGSGLGLADGGFTGSEAGTKKRLKDIAAKIKAAMDAGGAVGDANTPAKRMKYNPATGRLE